MADSDEEVKEKVMEVTEFQFRMELYEGFIRFCLDLDDLKERVQVLEAIHEAKDKPIQ